jgi:hypothetical protein
MHIAMLAPIAWRTPPRHYGPWENVASLLTEGLVSCGHDVTLFATADSQTSAKLHAVCPQGYEEEQLTHPQGLGVPAHLGTLRACRCLRHYPQPFRLSAPDL